MCDPVPSSPVTHENCLDCGFQVAFPGFTYCTQCADKRHKQAVEQSRLDDEEPVRVFVNPATVLPPTGAATSKPAVDPGLQSDGWSLHQQQFGGPHAGKLKKIGQSMDPKDLTIEVKYYESNHTSMVRVDLTHKPTGLKVSGESFADQKEAIHSRLYGELKGKVEKLQADAVMLEQAFRDSWEFKAFGRFDSLRKELKTPGFCDGPKYSEREAFEMAIAAEARIVPAPIKRWTDVYKERTGHKAPLPLSSVHREHVMIRELAQMELDQYRAAAEARTVPEPQLLSAVRELVSAFEFLVVEELSGTSQYQEKMALADKVRQLMGGEGVMTTHYRSGLSNKGCPAAGAIKGMHERNSSGLCALCGDGPPHPKASIPEAIEHSWKMYKLGQVSADHTAKEVFVGVLEKFAEWMGKPEPQPKDQPVKILLRELLGISTSNRRGDGAKVADMRNLIQAFQEKHIFLPLVPTNLPEQPSPQVHPASALPSRRPE